MYSYDYLIVGAGLAGATFAHLASLDGKRCLVIDKRNHIGGNLYCEDINGINVHRYGAHIFHTSDADVWHFVNSLAPFNRFINSPLAKAPDGALYNLPFNMNTFHRLWGVDTPAEAEAELTSQRTIAIERILSSRYHDETSDANIEQAWESIEPANLEEQALLLVGPDIYEKLIKGYTEKQWGRPCSQLPPFIIRRLPLRLTYDNNYFNDLYQGVPIGGYNPIITRMLDGSDIILGEDFFNRRDYWTSQAPVTVFTGCVDQFYDYRFGRLDYRSLRFDLESLSLPNFQGNAVVNYTAADIPYTRIIEHKHFQSFGNEVYDNPLTVITREYPVEFTPDVEPYYPVNDLRNQQLYNRYQDLTLTDSGIIFIGRLAEYRYYDMAPLIARVRKLYSSLRNGLNH